jgi:hypothetical protein
MSPKETKADRMLRYEAQFLAAKLGKSRNDALAIAVAVIDAKKRRDLQMKSTKNTAKRILGDRHFSQHSKEFLGENRLHGRPLAGGAPGLGKRR